jgi:hypothetical protein
MNSDLSSFRWGLPQAGFAWAAITQPTKSQIRRKDKERRVEWEVITESWKPPIRPKNEYIPKFAGWLESAAADAAVEGPILYRPLPGLMPNGRSVWRDETPLKAQPGLFLRFANLPQSAAAIRDFANQFGLLTGCEDFILAPWLDKKGALSQGLTQAIKSRTLVAVESLLTWRQEIALLNFVVSLWKSSKSDDVESQVFEVIHRSFDELFRARWPLSVLRALGEARYSARRALDVVVTEGFRRQLERANRQHVVETTGISVAITAGRRTYSPGTLLGAMWEQCLVAIQEDREFRRCPARQCPKVWFEVSTSPQGVRGDAEFCSPYCRHTAYRDRKKRAIELAGKGHTASQIARSLSTDVARVRNWIAKTQRKGVE